MRENLSVLGELGFETEETGDRDFVIRTVPAQLPELSEKEFLKELINGFSEIGDQKSPVLLREKIASMACKAAVKGNHRVTETEMKALLDELLLLEDPYHCPHGRPVMIRYQKTELDKLFRRIL